MIHGRISQHDIPLTLELLIWIPPEERDSHMGSIRANPIIDQYLIVFVEQMEDEDHSPYCSFFH